MLLSEPMATSVRWSHWFP